MVIVVQDWFIDINLIEFLKRAEMLKPPTPSPGPKHDESNVDDTEDYFPNIGMCRRMQGGPEVRGFVTEFRDFGISCSVQMDGEKS